MNWYLDVLKKYVDFSGRARRQEYWMFALINTIIYLILAVIEYAVGGSREVGRSALGGIYSLAVLLPSLGVSVRRLHDTGRSGWWLLLNLIPCVGGIIYLVFMIEDSQVGDNQYGPNPKGVEA